MGFQHRSSWLDLGRILMSQSKLIAFVYQAGKNMRIIYEELPKRDLLYYAGALKDGGVKDYHKSENLMKPLEDSNESSPTKSTFLIIPCFWQTFAGRRFEHAGDRLPKLSYNNPAWL